MQHVLGTQTVLARIGGDEFVYLCNSADPVECKATKLIDAFVQPLAVAGSEIPVSPSIGLASFPHDGETVEELLRNADTAMASAKQRGRNQVQAFTSAMAEGRRQRLTLESALKRALQQDEFKLVYQPKYDLFKRKLTGVEALLRWDSRELGRVSPEQFIGIAENSGLILPISQWVLKEALSQSARWTERGVTGVKIAVNVSTLQLRQRHFARFVIDALALAGVSPELLELEITESLLMDEAEHSISQLNELRASGISIAIDDFGAAYSSLTYLRKLPIDTLKIDRSFIQGLGSDSDSTSIAKTIILLAQSLDLRTVAEGVEDDAQAEWLVQQECQEIQGFWLSPGIEADELTRFWSEFKPRTQARVIELASSRPPSAKNANQGG
jgi:predicted signal transduction protein with EAL and GGDEF domain